MRGRGWNVSWSGDVDDDGDVQSVAVEVLHYVRGTENQRELTVYEARLLDASCKALTAWMRRVGLVLEDDDDGEGDDAGGYDREAAGEAG